MAPQRNKQLRHISSTRSSASNQLDDTDGLKTFDKNRLSSYGQSVRTSTDFNQRHSTMATHLFRRCYSVSASTALGHSPKLLNDSLLKYSLPLSQQDQAFPEHNFRHTSPKSGNMGWHIPRQWSRMQKGIKIRKVPRIKSRRFNRRNKQDTITKGNSLRYQEFSSETSGEDINPIYQDTWNSRFGAAHKIESENHINANLSHKYQPKVFQDIAGHDITVKAISKAVEKMKIASMYLFHGPSGTGKTSTATIFSMALNCESTSFPKPCWSCRGCSRSLFIMDVCSGSRTAGFERIKTLLQSTSFTRAIPGFKVLIIKQCHLISAEAWDELLSMVEKAYGFGVVFVLVTVNANMVPLNISSICQKFCFPKLNNKEITLKLAKIVASEDIRIEKEALKLIAATAEGSLREAENLLDQLALLGSTITSSMVQQLVGLLPQDKLLDLLTTAISGDAIKTIRITSELIATGVEPPALVSQLASLITDILSDAAVAASSSPSSFRSLKDNRLLKSIHQLANSQSERLCHALKVLVETEKQLRSSTDKNTRIMAALLEITSKDASNRMSTGIVWPRNAASGGKSTATSEDLHSPSLVLNRSNGYGHSISISSEQPGAETNEPCIPIKGITQPQRSGIPEYEQPHLAHMSDMEEIWRNMLRRIQNRNMKEFLLQAKLASLTVSSANIIVHLMFRRPEDKKAAQISEESIEKVLQSAVGCPVMLNISLEPVELESMGDGTANAKSQSCNHSELQQRIPFLAKVFNSRNSDVVMPHSSPQETSPPSESSRPTKFKDKTKSQGQCIFATEQKGENAAHPQHISPFLGLSRQKNGFDTYVTPYRGTLTREQTSKGTHLSTTNKPKNRWLSLSSIPQSDASVEPYSRDISFEKANKERESNARKNQKFLKRLLGKC